mmetsp:Transcript_13465/g.30549  ORF Transcript_13465/g.30549 Transcript_13465/m.30549 type:complete len:262 (+) Transcript_13465:205-990(+)
MPHLLIDRLRSNPLAGLQIHKALVPIKRRSFVSAVLVECLDVLAGLIFIVGSICFLPEYAHDVSTFINGCALFVVGAIIFMFISSLTSWEAIRHCGCKSLETFENMLYLVGSAFFLIGTLLYWPDKAHTYGIESLKSMSLGVYFNLFSPVFEGTVLFIVGSLLFALAAFVNGLNLNDEDTTSRQLLTVTTTSYLIGSILFIVGSIALLPTLGGTDEMEASGAWCFILGSILYVIGSSVSLWRTLRCSKSDEQLSVAQVPSS